MKPWLMIWIKPRQTIRYLQDTPSNPLIVWILICLNGIDYSLNQFVNQSAGDSNPLSFIITVSLMGGPILGIILFYISTIILKWIGKWFGGKATLKQIRLAWVWSTVPNTVSLILWALQILLYGNEIFKTESPLINEQSTSLVIISVTSVFQIILFIWSFVIFIKVLSEVQEFSVGKAIASTFFPALALVSLVVVWLMLLPFFLSAYL